MKKTIAHIVHWPKSGIGTVVKQLVEHDSSGEFDYIVVLLETDLESEKQFMNLGAQVLGVSISKHPISSLKKIRRGLSTADIVHTHSFLPEAVNFFSSKKKSHTVRTIHNTYPYFKEKNLRAALKRVIEWYFISASRADQISVSKDAHRSIPWPTPDGAISVVIENGISKPKAISQESSAIERPDGLLIVTLGRLEHQKGFDILLEAMSALDPKLENNKKVTLWIIGDGSCRESLEAQAETLKLKNVQFKGYQSAPQSYLAKGDIFVLPSRFEGFALAAMEAMAIGLPVVLTSIGGIADQLTHGVNAHIVPKENPEALSNALLTMLNDQAYCSALAKNGKAFVENNFSVEKCVSQYASIYARFF